MVNKKKKKTKSHATLCVDYLLESEQNDFIEYCAENGHNPSDGLDKIPHIYCDAVLATYKGKNLKEKIAELQKEVDYSLRS